MESLKHYSIKLLTAFSAFVLLLSLTSLIVLNSGVLDQFARERVIALFNEKFFGRLELQELHLKFPNKVTLINPRIYAPGETTAALDARTISLKFNILSLLQPDIRKLYIRNLTAEKLNARVVEENNGKLNLELVFKSRDPDSTKAPLDHFFCKKMKITGSSLSWSGRKSDPERLQLAVNDINAELSAFTVKENFLDGTLEKLGFSIPEHHVVLRQASGKFLFSENRSELLALKVAANKSRAEISATLDHFNIFSQQRQKELAGAAFFLNAQELSLQSDDLKLLYPELALPPGMYTLRGNARGKEDSVELLDAILKHQKSKVALKGKLLNLQSSSAFAYALKCDSSRIAAPFLDSLLKEGTLKELARKSGDITFLGSAKGTLKAVKADVTTLSELGEVSLSGEASAAAQEEFTGKGTFQLKGCKPHLFVRKEGMKSLLNASGTFEGRGNSRQISRLLLEMKLADSFWQNQPVKDGSIVVKYGNRLLSSTLLLNNSPTSFTLDGEIDWKEQAPRYRASGKTTALDISKILGSKEFTTDLNGMFTVQGSGFDPKMVNLAATMQFSPSTINSIQLKERAKVAVDIVQNASSSKASIKSDFLDLLAEGDYTFEELIALGKVAASAISREIAAQNIWRTHPLCPLLDRRGSKGLLRSITASR